MAYYDRVESHFIRYIGQSALVLPLDINWVSLELIIFGSSPGRIRIETNINNDIRHHKTNYCNNYVKLYLN